MTKRSHESMLYEFSIYDQGDGHSSNPYVYACSSFGPDFYKMPNSKASVAFSKAVEVQVEMGWWDEEFDISTSDLSYLTRQLRDYLHWTSSHNRLAIIVGPAGQQASRPASHSGLHWPELAKSDVLKMTSDI